MVVTVVGARPQFIKAAVLSQNLKQRGIKELIIHTGQHYDYKMNDVFFEELGLKGADVNLNVGSASHGKQTADILAGIEKVLIGLSRPVSKVVVFGDTNSTLAGALAASKLHIPVVHIEAGLRSYNRSMPEEVNRVVTDHLSSILFCSSEVGVTNLLREGISKNVYVCGDIMLDAFQLFSQAAATKIKLSDVVPPDTLAGYYLLTIHRAESVNNLEFLSEVFRQLREIPANIIWPVHPGTRKVIKSLQVPENVKLFEPFSYFEMLVVLNGCRKVLTDSGGLQKEAYWAKKPCVTLRSETEWVETTHNNWNVVAGTHNSTDLQSAIQMQVNPKSWIPLYGTGNASDMIAQIIGK